ncbi:DEAD/DEAH box helicase family protein [Bacillus cereus]|uniref:DEAD/DEAH box helicase family protein n=1 Tax=Bacillus cereus TaxID=1396 RepID=UPI002B24D5BB|nr:DEAD/DEAH box helicase family protein [Bacillus cereus]MEB2584693.1 DEAD/DEAH box helicase family protein [Bacillus cereus]MEB2612172.1 DEAD/DEAH box helicase family protein [Bacillus cereus]
MLKYSTLLTQSYNSWSDLEKVLGNLTGTKAKGDAFEEFAKYYFLLHKEFYQIDKVYMRDEIPIEIVKSLKLERTDHGVDGIIVRKDGKIIAYQVKFRTDRISPSYTELATFWTESEHADFRLIITNATNLPSATERRKQQMAVLLDTLEQLNSDFFSDMKSLIEGQVPKRKEPPTPRPYQEKILTEILQGFLAEDKGKLLAACGSGKTLIAKWLSDRMDSQNTLFIAPSLSLIKQTIEEWTSKTEKPFVYLAVCSDQTVINDVEADESELKVSEANFPVTTEPAVIQEFVRNKSEYPKVIFSTYQSLDAIMNALLDEEFSFDLALFDESHRTAGVKDSPMFTYALKDEFIPIKKRLFMTATERFVTDKIKKHAEESGASALSMDNIEQYGITFSELNFGAAIEQGIIADYRVVVCTMAEDELYELVEKNHYIQLDIGDDTNTSTIDNLMKQVILAKAVKELNVKKIVTYHSKVDIARKFISGDRHQPALRDVFTQVAPHIKDSELFLDHVSGYMTSGERKKILATFEQSEYGVISNAKCLTEGVDVPSIDAVYFSDPKDSTIDIIQAIGRALRKKQTEEKTSYILIPVILPKGVTSFSGLRTELFDTLHSVVQALRDQDKKLAHIIDEVNYVGATNGGIPRKGNLNRGLQQKVQVLTPNKINIADFEGSLQFRIGDVNKEAFDAPYKLAGTKEKGGRKGSIKRVFTSMGDYNMDAYKTSLALPTLEKFSSQDEIKSGSDIKINNNNVSHTMRLGAIEKYDKKNYRLTPIGKMILEDPSKFETIFKHQLLRYHIVNEADETILFPYRAWFKVLKEVGYIRKLDFIYCLYPLRNTDEATIQLAVERVKYLQNTYVNPDILSDENKEKVLQLLNKKFEINLDFKDVWSSRGTSYNQFNYFAKHLLAFDNMFQKGSQKHQIHVTPGTRVNIITLLSETEYIENVNDVAKLQQLYRTM